jgi:cyclopropane-fatty-acyl-phospholipid synthase
MAVAGKHAAVLKDFLAHARERLGLDLGFILWDGSRVPAGLAMDALAVTIADEGAIAALLRRPKIPTLANLWVAGRLDIRNGTIFDVAGLRSRVRTRQFVATLDKRLLLRTLATFAFLPRGAPWPLEALPADKRSGGSASENKRHIQYHYDVSNAFYALFLDPELVYSCAYFIDWTNDLAQAQHDKLEMICRKLRLSAGESLLDIGCGWGALVCHAARHHGVRAHGVTLSQQQFSYASEKVAQLGLQDRVTIELKDYSALQASFDKIASIGMFEHVGIDNHPAYFGAIHRLLKPGGLYLHHAITRPAKRNDRVFRKKRPEYEAIVRYIFPGAELDHIGMSIANLERHGFEAHDVESWRSHYALTCRHWHDRLNADRNAAEREVGVAKTRLWLAYLAGCSLGFERGSIGIFQTLASKRVRGRASLPPTRADLYRAK